MTRVDDGLSTETLLLLWAARETGALDALSSSAGTPEALAAEADITPRAAETIVSTLVDRGFLEPVGEEYEPTNRALGFLAKRDVRSIGELPRRLDEIDALIQLPETMRTGEPPARSADWTRNRLGADEATDEATVRAQVTAAVREAPDAETVLVLAGGSGVHAREFAARGFDVRMLDDPEVVDAVEPRLDPTDVTVTAAALGAVTEPVDLIFGVNLCTRTSAAEAKATIDCAEAVLGTGGRLALVETIADRAADAVDTDVRRLALGAGGARDEDTYRDWFAAANLSAIQVRDVPGTDRSIIVGRSSERTVQGN